MSEFRGYVTKDRTSPMSISEYFIITDKVRQEDVVARLGNEDDIMVLKHKSMLLFVPKSGGMVYALEIKREVDEVLDVPSGDYKPEVNTKIPMAGSHKFSCFVMAVVLALTMTLTTVDAATVSGTLTDSPRDITALSDVSFKTPTSTLVIETKLTDVAANGYNETGYSLNDPRVLAQPKPIRAQSLNPSINKDKVTAILMYSKVYSLDAIAKNTGLNVSQDQLDAAVQLSIWRHSILAYNDYQIQESSISDATVRSLSSAIDTWADNQAKNKPSKATMANAILPPATPKLNTSKADKKVTDTGVVFGPYLVSSNPSVDMTVEFTAGYLMNEAGERLSQVKSGETFYAVVPPTFGGTADVTLSAQAIKYSLYYSGNRVWLHREYQPVTVKFVLSTSIGSNGILDVVVFDSMTNMPLEEVEIAIKNATSTITVLMTNASGTVDYQLPVGSYTLEITPPKGFLPYDEIPVTIGFIGDIQAVNIPLSRSEGVVNFYAIDSSTLASAGYCEAYIYKDGEPIKRLALEDGACVGITLPAGNYVASVYKTMGNYSISGPIPLTVVEGVMQDLNLHLIPETPKTVVRTSDNRNKQNWKFSFYKQGEYIFTLNNNGAVELNMPMGIYQVIAETTDNSYHVPAYEFTIAMVDNDVVIPIVIGEHKVSFQFVDTVVEEPIPNLVVGIFDQAHKLLQYGTLDTQGKITFEDIVYGNVYYINVIAAPDSVSGYSANGNRFIGQTKSFTVKLYGSREIEDVTLIDTLWRLPNVVYSGVYEYPEIKLPATLPSSADEAKEQE